MPVSVFRSKCLTVPSNKDCTGRRKSEKSCFQKWGKTAVFFEPLTRSWTQAAAKIYIEFTPNHYVVTSVLVSHMASCALMRVVTALIASAECVHQPARFHQ